MKCHPTTFNRFIIYNINKNSLKKNPFKHIVNKPNFMQVGTILAIHTNIISAKVTHLLNLLELCKHPRYTCKKM